MLINDVVPFDQDQKNKIISGLENFAGKNGSAPAPMMPPTAMGQQLMGNNMMAPQMQMSPQMQMPMSPQMSQMPPQMSPQMQGMMPGMMQGMDMNNMQGMDMNNMQGMMPGMDQMGGSSENIIQGLANFI